MYTKSPQISTQTAVVLVAVLPDYRREFIDELIRVLGPNQSVQLIAGDKHMDATVKSAPHPDVRLVRNRTMVGRRFIWQAGTSKIIWSPRTLVVDLNPRSLTTWMALLVRAPLRERRTLVWGHVHPRRGSDASTASLRRLVRRLADGVISYTWNDARDVLAEGPDQEIWVAANGLYTDEELGWAPDTRRFRALYVGRLESGKKPGLALEAFAQAQAHLPEEAKLTMVGRGSLESALRARAAELNLGERVEFLGHVNDRRHLQELYDESVVGLSPGYAGLSLTQSLGFGVPVLVADDEPHAPEIELLTSETGSTFAAGDPKDLAAKLLDFYSPERAAWDHAGIVASVKSKYSATAMAIGFSNALLDKDGVQPW